MCNTDKLEDLFRKAIGDRASAVVPLAEVVAITGENWHTPVGDVDLLLNTQIIPHPKDPSLLLMIRAG